jgi:hypothetical protein
VFPPQSRIYEVVNTSYSSPDKLNNNQEPKHMIDQLERIFHESDSRSEKVKILTVLPPSWGVQRTAREFQTSNWMTRKATNLVKMHGILSSPTPQPSKVRLSQL